MDKLDIKLLRELFQSQAISPLDPNFRKSYRLLADRLNVHSDTIRNRIHRFHRSGFIRGWHIHVNPALTGFEQAVVWFELPKDSHTADLIEKLKLIHGVVIIPIYMGNFGAVVLSYESEASLGKQTELVKRISNAENIVRRRIPWPDCTTKLSKTDWSIVKAIQRNPRERIGSISRRLHLSTRTIKRRLDRMTRGGVLFAVADLDPKVVLGAISTQLIVSYPAAKKTDVDSRILSRFDEYVWHVFHTEPFNREDLCYTEFNMMIPNISKGREIVEWTEGQPGVASSRIEYVEDYLMLFETLDEQQERLSQEGRPAENPKVRFTPSRRRQTVVGARSIGLQISGRVRAPSGSRMSMHECGI